jgi:serine/threonine protein kinase/Tol biopolymer transport system component
MSLAPGTSLGPYEIVSALGAGGMGEVYRAKDTRLGRDVAIKILPPEMSLDTTRRQRFEREAKIVSGLNHPNICVLHDIGNQNGMDYLVMECVEGETLAARLKRGPLPLGQVTKYGAQIADALDKAHRSGVVHRDLKPGNIMLTKSGAKLLDFGLAKPSEETPATTLTTLPARGKASRTTQSELTEEGAILGTLRYMSPEALDGKEADERSDIFALGAVLYEMTTGKRAFEGKTLTGVMAAILEGDPIAPSQVQPMSPPNLDRLVKQCLAKDPDERMQSAHDVRLQLEGIGEAAAAERLGSGKKGWRTALWAVAALCLGAAITIGITSRLPLPQPKSMFRSLLLPPAGTSFKQNNFALSPDGTRLAFAATGRDGVDIIWLRTLSGAGAQPMKGSEGAMFPFWSPDSRSLGFFALGKLKVLDTASGTIRTLCEAVEGRGGTWNQEGTIVFAPDIIGPLFRIENGGGAPAQATELAQASRGQAHRWPFFLPDGNHFLYFVDWSSPDDPQNNGIYVGSLDGQKPKLISSELAGNVVFVQGRLLYARDRSLMAQPFSASRLEFTGPAVSLAQQEIATDLAFSQSGFTASENGVLVFQSTTDTTSQLAWFDSTGKELGGLAENGYGEPRISPNGRLVAFDSDDERNGKSYIRTHDISRGISTRLTEGGNEMNPTWSPDGKRVAYEVGFRTGTSIYEVAADASTAPKLLLKGPKMAHIDWSPDDRLLFSSWAKGRPLLNVYSFADQSAADTGAPGAEGRLSPNGKWVACVGVGTGVYVSPFPEAHGHLQISHGDAAQPVWSRDGRKLFFIEPDKTMAVASFDPDTGKAGAPVALFKTRVIASSFVGTQYDVSPDGKFLIHSVPADNASPLTLLTGWATAATPK